MDFLVSMAVLDRRENEDFLAIEGLLEIPWRGPLAPLDQLENQDRRVKMGRLVNLGKEVQLVQREQKEENVLSVLPE